jgi:divalent metal cation (Fe/Co/Zn/Cd) transporter
VAEGHAIAGRIKADILKSHPEVVSVLVHVEPDMPEHRKQDGHHRLRGLSGVAFVGSAAWMGP